jgi:hypothetical protein
VLSISKTHVIVKLETFPHYAERARDSDGVVARFARPLTHVSRHVTFTEDQFPACAIPGQSEHPNNVSNSPSEREFGTSSGQIPDQAHESDSDDISDLVKNSESESSVSDNECDSHGIPDLEEDHDGGVEEIADCESSDALPESEIGADVNREDEV